MNRISRDNYGQPTNRPHANSPDSRPVTRDARLACCIHNLWDKAVHEFWLDGENLGAITLEEALRAYSMRTGIQVEPTQRIQSQ